MLISLIDYVEGSLYTITAIFAGLLMVGIHFLLPSHLLISAIAMLLLISMFCNYLAERVVVIAFWFILWIATNIPYMRGWSFPFDVLDILHGISHICASVGIYLTINIVLRINIGWRRYLKRKVTSRLSNPNETDPGISLPAKPESVFRFSHCSTPVLNQPVEGFNVRFDYILTATSYTRYNP
jgi:hypothetical protein